MMFWTIITILLALWMLSLIANVGGNLIHLFLLVAVILFLVRIFSDHQSTV
ncbi:MAG: lmo0937 family membrane protein [Blastocatellia bacterium]|nr:lmo0937 family membrane protein [Blastocatellia bacterium]